MAHSTFLSLLLLVCSVFGSQAFAANDSFEEDNIVRENTPIFHLYDDLDLISTQKIIYGKPRVVVKAIYPRLESDVGRDTIDKFNEIIAEMIQDAVHKFQKDIKAENVPQNPKARKNDLFIDYNSALIQSGRYHILSIRLSMQGMGMGMAHPFHYHRVLNYNLSTGEKIGLSDLFHDDSDYLEVLAKYSARTLMRRLVTKERIAEGTAATAENYSLWNLTPSGILITFEEYRVAPYVFGSQTVLIPYKQLKSVLSQHSLTKCMRKGQCTRRPVLTGGFLEAS